MNDSPVRFRRHVLVYGLGAMLLQVANILLLPLYTHYLDAAEYGVLQIVYRIGEIFSICLMVQAIRLATFNLLGNSAEEAARQCTAASVAAITLMSILLGSATALALGPSLDRLMSIGDPWLLICGVITLMLQSLTVMPLAMMQARYESLPYVAATVGIALCHVALTSVAVAVLGWGIWGVIASLAVTHLSFGVALTVRELSRSSLAVDPLLIRRFVRFAIPMIPVGVLSIAMHNGDQLVLMHVEGAAVVGVYALAYRMVQALEVFATEPLCQLWHPWMYQVFRRDDGPLVMGRAATQILAAYAVVGLGLVIFRRETIWALSGPEFWAAAQLIPVLVLAFFFMAASSLIDASFYVSSRTAWRTPIAVLAAGMMLTLYFVLIPRFGALGAAYATLIGFVGNWGLNLMVAQRAYVVRYEYGRLTVLLGSAIVWAGAAELLGDGWAWVLPKLIVWLSWPVALWFCGAVIDDEKLRLHSLVRWRNRAESPTRGR